MANLDTTTQTAKLAISATVKVDQQVNKEIELPYFFRSMYGTRCMITEDKKMVQARFHAKNICSIYVTESLSKHEHEDISSGTPITAEEFFTTIESAYETISKELKNAVI